MTQRGTYEAENASPGWPLGQPSVASGLLVRAGSWCVATGSFSVRTGVVMYTHRVGIVRVGRFCDVPVFASVNRNRAVRC
jgi:hypothetical protein